MAIDRGSALWVFGALAGCWLDRKTWNLNDKKARARGLQLPWTGERVVTKRRNFLPTCRKPRSVTVRDLAASRDHVNRPACVGVPLACLATRALVQ